MEKRRFEPKFSNTYVQHADFYLDVDGCGTQLLLNSFDFGPGWVKLWVSVTENHDEKVAVLLSAKNIAIVAQHPDVDGEIVRRSIESPRLVHRVIGSTASPDVVQEELWFAAPGVEIPHDSTDVRLKDAIRRALHELPQASKQD